MQTPAERALGSLKKHGAWLQNKGRDWFNPRQEVWSLAATQGMERPGKVFWGQSTNQHFKAPIFIFIHQIWHT
jgi:hypothetical protein